MARRRRRGPVGPTISQAAPRGKCASESLGGELLVIDLVIVPADALLGHAGGAAGFKDVEGAALEFFGHPDFRLQVAQPFVLEMREALQAGEAFDFGGGIPAGLLGPIQPERAAGFRAKNAIA